MLRANSLIRPKQFLCSASRLLSCSFSLFRLFILISWQSVYRKCHQDKYQLFQVDKSVKCGVRCRDRETCNRKNTRKWVWLPVGYLFTYLAMFRLRKLGPGVLVVRQQCLYCLFVSLSFLAHGRRLREKALVASTRPSPLFSNRCVAASQCPVNTLVLRRRPASLLRMHPHTMIHSRTYSTATVVRDKFRCGLYIKIKLICYLQYLCLAVFINRLGYCPSVLQ